MIARGALICHHHCGLVWGGERGEAGGKRAGGWETQQPDGMLRAMSSPGADLGVGLASLVARLRFFPALQFRRFR